MDNGNNNPQKFQGLDAERGLRAGVVGMLAKAIPATTITADNINATDVIQGFSGILLIESALIFPVGATINAWILDGGDTPDLENGFMMDHVNATPNLGGDGLRFLIEAGQKLWIQSNKKVRVSGWATSYS